MNWEALKEMRCPRDNRMLEEVPGEVRCINCYFRVGRKRFKELLAELYRGPRVYVLEAD